MNQSNDLEGIAMSRLGITWNIPFRLGGKPGLHGVAMASAIAAFLVLGPT